MRDQRLKLGHLAFLAKWFTVSIPFLLHSILHLPKPDSWLFCVSCCGGALHPGQLKESWTLSLSGPCPAPSNRDDFKIEWGEKGKPHHSQKSGSPFSFHSRCPSSIFTASMALSYSQLLASFWAPEQRTKISTAGCF